jgi:hypothetical protein
VTVDPTIPETRATHLLTLSLLWITDPDQLKIGISKEEATTGCALAGMRVRRSFLEPKTLKPRRFRCVDRGQDEDVIEFGVHEFAVAGPTRFS